MNYRICHTTVYEYSGQVGLCQNLARLQPRQFMRQQCEFSRLDISPYPVDYCEREDFFGNRVAYFAIQQPHAKLTVAATSLVSVAPLQSVAKLSLSETWEQVRDRLQAGDLNDEILEARQYILDSPMVMTSPELAEYGRRSFVPDCPLITAVQELMRRIYDDFTYDPEFTTIATPLSDVLLHRRGVCQDFAHLAIGCLRSYGLAARYVSGYIETVPPEGVERLIGADASHAWFSVFVPGFGWLDFDPTNNQLPEEQHITLAWGRDYADVTPLKGIAYGGGSHKLSVSVDVQRVESVS
ncbi:MAG: transglutaminase family protein [Gammaproteobacteria bacterium]